MLRHDTQISSECVAQNRSSGCPGWRWHSLCPARSRCATGRLSCVRYFFIACACSKHSSQNTFSPLTWHVSQKHVASSSPHPSHSTSVVDNPMMWLTASWKMAAFGRPAEVGGSPPPGPTTRVSMHLALSFSGHDNAKPRRISSAAADASPTLDHCCCASRPTPVAPIDDSRTRRPSNAESNDPADVAEPADAAEPGSLSASASAASAASTRRSSMHAAQNTWPQRSSFGARPARSSYGRSQMLQCAAAGTSPG